jgi:hypothetical protein
VPAIDSYLLSAVFGEARMKRRKEKKRKEEEEQEETIIVSERAEEISLPDEKRLWTKRDLGNGKIFEWRAVFLR